MLTEALLGCFCSFGSNRPYGWEWRAQRIPVGRHLLPSFGCLRTTADKERSLCLNPKQCLTFTLHDNVAAFMCRSTSRLYRRWRYLTARRSWIKSKQITGQPMSQTIGHGLRSLSARAYSWRHKSDTASCRPKIVAYKLPKRFFDKVSVIKLDNCENDTLWYTYPEGREHY